MNEPEVMRRMLGAKALAVVGMSAREDRPSHYVSAYLQAQGYGVYPVNPALTGEVLGVRVYGTLAEAVAEGFVGVVNVFRAASFVPGIVDEMMALGLQDLWVQQGIVDVRSAARAEAAGIRVVMDRCLMVEHRRLMG